MITGFLTPAGEPAKVEPAGLPVLWSVVIRDAVDSGPAIAPDGTIYFGTFGGKVWAISPDGQKKWVYRAGREVKSCVAIGADGALYFGSRDRKLYAVAPDGKKKWDFLTGGWVDSSPAIAADGTVYFGSWDHKFYAVNSQGVKKWQFETAGPVVSSPVITPSAQICFGSHDRKFYALTADGKKSWDYTAGGPIISSPAVDKEGTLFFTSVDGLFHCLNSDGTPKWRLKTGGITESSPVLGQDGTIYVGVNQDLWAISPEGIRKWEQPWRVDSPQLIRTSPLAMADGSVWLLTGTGRLLNLEQPHQHRFAADLQGIATSQPAIGPDGSLYTFTGKVNVGYILQALQTTNGPLASSSWPKFRGDPGNTGNPRHGP